MKKLMKKTSVIMLICMFFISACLAVPCEVQAASKKPSISKKTVTLQKGKTKTLKVRHAKKKVKWSSTNKKIVRIKKVKGKKHQKAVIKARKAGTCYIKAKVGKKTLKCKVKVTKAKTVTVYPPDEQPGLEDRKIVKRAITSSTDLTAKMKANPPADAKPSSAFVNGASNFAFDLFKSTIKDETGKKTNILISPDSVMTALAMTENGAANNTLAEMETVLGGGTGISSDDFNKYLSGLNRRMMKSDEYIYSVANSIWARKDLVRPKSSFLQTNKNYYDAQYYVSPFDSNTINDMNAWVYNNSRNMIDKIITSLSKDSRMVLINTVAFEGVWEKQFNESAKSTESFTAKDGTVQKAAMLNDTDDYPYFELKGGKAFAKFYRSGSTGAKIAYVGILPPKGTDVDKYIESLKGEEFAKAWNNRKSAHMKLTMPEFTYDYNTEMGSSLKEMGIKEAFTDDADFTRMADMTADTPGLKISKVLHKTHIEVTANGTKAAAATAVIMEKCGAAFGQETIQMRFDRPFVYALVDADTGIPLFIGELASVK